MKFLKLLLPLLVSTAVNAQTKTTTTVDLSSKNYSAQVSYEVLNSNSPAKAHKTINKLVLEAISDGCDPLDASESEYGHDYSAQATIIAENADYVGYEVNVNSYCGGAHPNYYTYNLIFDALTGQTISINKEVPRQDFDNADTIATFYDDLDVYQKELAIIIANNIKPGIEKDNVGFEDCFTDNGMTKDELVDEISQLFPLISGLSENKKVVLSINPPHVMAACTFSVNVNYSEVSQYIRTDSILHTWLK